MGDIAFIPIPLGVGRVGGGGKPAISPARGASFAGRWLSRTLAASGGGGGNLCGHFTPIPNNMLPRTIIRDRGPKPAISPAHGANFPGDSP